MGRVSRNPFVGVKIPLEDVAPRMGRVSRNHILRNIETGEMVAPRMGRVSRNYMFPQLLHIYKQSRPAWGV